MEAVSSLTDKYLTAIREGCNNRVYGMHPTARGAFTQEYIEKHLPDAIQRLTQMGGSHIVVMELEPDDIVPVAGRSDEDTKIVLSRSDLGLLRSGRHYEVLAEQLQGYAKELYDQLAQISKESDLQIKVAIALHSDDTHKLRCCIVLTWNT